MVIIIVILILPLEKLFHFGAVSSQSKVNLAEIVESLLEIFKTHFLIRKVPSMWKIQFREFLFFLFVLINLNSVIC